MKQDKERRVINIDKDLYNLIKEYCDFHSLKMSAWLPQIALEKIFMELQSRKQSHDDINCSLPSMESTVKTYIGHPEKFSQYREKLWKKLGITTSK